MKRIILDKANCIAGMIVGWSVLGFYRGVKESDYYDLMSNQLTRKPYLYSDILTHGARKLGCGIYGSMVYINPFLLIHTIPREIYRLEVNIRGLEFEKKTDKYHRIN